MAGEPRRARERVRAAARKGMRAAARALDEEAAAIAQEVYEACVTFEARGSGDPLPLAIRGPLFMLGARAVQVIRESRPGAIRSEDDALDVIAYLTEGWCSMMLAFNREHFEQWRARRATEGQSQPEEVSDADGSRGG